MINLSDKKTIEYLIMILCLLSGIFGFTVGTINGEYNEMKYLTDMTYNASISNHMIKNDFGYYSIYPLNISSKYDLNQTIFINTTKQ